MVKSEIVGLSTPDFLQRALPAVVVKVEQYFGSFVRLECTSPDGGELELRVYLADWIFLARGVEFGDSSGGATRNNELLAALQGGRLLEIVVNGGDQLWLMFSEGMSLQIMANFDEYEPEDELLIAYMDMALLKFIPTQGFVVAPPVRREH